MTNRQILQQALETLENVTNYVNNNTSDYPTGIDTSNKVFDEAEATIEALRDALAQHQMRSKLGSGCGGAGQVMPFPEYKPSVVAMMPSQGGSSSVALAQQGEQQPVAKDLMWATVAMQERHDQRIENTVATLEKIKQEQAARYQPVKEAFWWRVRIGDGAQTIGRCYTETEAQRLAAELQRAFNDGAFCVEKVVCSGDLIGAAAPTAQQCSGIPRKGCNYLSACGSICNKCGKEHNAAELLAVISEPAEQPKTWTDDGGWEFPICS